MPRRIIPREPSIGELAAQNPWWSDPHAIDNDINIQSFNNSKVKWIPRVKFMFDWDTDLIYTVRGPRQVGKTTLLKLVIKDFLAKVPPDHVLFFNCENLDRRNELVALIKAYVNWIRRRSQQRIYLFIDESTAVDQWQRAVKFLVDNGELRKATCVFSGSHSIDIKTCAERLPGRRGQSEVVLDKLMLPMKFSEYVETLDNQIRRIMKENRLLSEEYRKSVLISLFSGKISEELDKILAIVDKLNGYFEQYLITGGVVPVVDDFMKSGRIADSRYRDYLNVVLGDMARLNLRESYIKQIISRVTETLGTPVSWRTVANNTDIPHHDTVAQYIERLKDNFTVSYIYRLNLQKEGPAFEKDKKIHFSDPFIFHALRAWVHGGAPYKETLEYLKDPMNSGHLAECVVCNHAIRLAFLFSNQKHIFDATANLFYWRIANEKDKEIDLVIKNNDNFLPLEVKYQEDINSSDLFAISKFRSMSKSSMGLILTKEQFKVLRNAVTLPISLFLLLI